MGKPKITREVTARDVNCLENVVVAYNTMFLMSSIFIVSVAGTIREVFEDFFTVLSPSSLLLFITCFIILTAGLGYAGIAKKSSFLITLYTLLLVFVFSAEVFAGFGILSFRREIRSVATSKMRMAIADYTEDPMTANFVDYAQLQLRCCGVNSFRDWDEIFDKDYSTNCRISDMKLPPSCCSRIHENSTYQVVNKNGCLPAISVIFHRSALSLTCIIIAICTIQILGGYFSAALSSTLRKYKLQTAEKENKDVEQHNFELPKDYKEKSNYF